MPRPSRFRWSAVVLTLVALCGPHSLGAQAQATTGIIRGVAQDSAGAPIVDASVTARNVATNFTRTAATNRQGAYALPLLPLGTYEVTARAIGYAPVRQAGIAVRLGATADVPFVLARQAVALAPVQVTGAREAIDKDRPAAATELDARVVAGLPNNGRNYLGLVLLTPNTAIVQGPDGDELSIAASAASTTTSPSTAPTSTTPSSASSAAASAPRSPSTWMPYRTWW